MRVFRFLAVGCAFGAVAVGAFTGGVWVARPQVTETAKQSMPTTAPKPRDMPKSQNKASTVVRPVSHETPQPPRDAVPVPDLPKAGEFPSLRGPDIVPLPPEKSGFAALPPLPAEPKPSAGALPPLPPPVFGRVDVPKPTEPATQYVNKPDLAFDYEVTKQGKSGVKAVTLFAQRMPAAADAKPNTTWAEAAKVEVGGAERPKLAYTLEEEGRYGFRIGVSSGTVTATLPKATDEPEVVVVFDKTPPVIEKFEAPQNPPANAILFRWKISELHSTDRPVVLDYQVPGDEKWHPITGSPGGNMSVWQIPNDVPATVRVRLTATDRAGNTSQKVIEGVNTDHTVPRGRLTGVKATDPPKKEPEGLRLPTVEGGAGLPPIPKSDGPTK